MQSPLESGLPPRTDSEKLLKELNLTLGEKEYIVPVLRSRAAAKWREEYFKRTQEINDAMPAKFEQDTDPAELAKAMGRGLLYGLLEFPEKIPDLIFSYAPSLIEHRDAILDNAFDQELRKAFQQIWQVAFEPFLASLGMVREMQLAQQVSASRSSASTN